MKKFIFLIAGSIVLLGGIAVGIYVANPYGTATWDPRGRILGFVPYRMPSRSMAPTLNDGDYLVVNTTAYASAEPAHNDVIIFIYPRNPSSHYLKRVIARGGDRVRISAGQVYVNDAPLAQDYLDPENVRGSLSREMPERSVPAGMLFVLGDNRDNSNDSRYWGFVPRENVIGRVAVTLGNGQGHD